VGTNEAMAVRNGSNLPVVFADSCSTASFDQNDAFGEELLLNPAGGAIAYLGNTRWSWIGLGDDIERLFWSRLLRPGYARPLGLAFDARMQMLSTPGWQMLWKWSCLALNLLGDPAMRPWTGVPSRIAVQAPARTTRHSTVAVRVSSPKGVPVAGARVCLYQRGRLLLTAVTSDAGTVSFTLSGAARGQATVTAIRPGAVPVQRQIEVV
jgi:hypothetical protein